MSKKAITAVVVVALLAGIAGFNYMMQRDPAQLAARGVGQGGHSHDHDQDHDHDEMPTAEQLLEPIGPENAPVTVEVLSFDLGEIEQLLRPMLGHIAASYEDRVRVKFHDPGTDEYAQLLEDVTSGVGAGLVINGEMIKEVPEADLGMLAFVGSPAMDDWGEREVRMAIEHELRTMGIDAEPAEHTHAEIHADPHAGHSHAPGEACTGH